MKIIAAGGGTSGHVNPALAIVKEMKSRYPDAEVLFFGVENKIEANIVPRAGFDIVFIPATGFSRRKNIDALKHNVKSVGNYLNSKKIVKKTIKDFNPDIVIGTGGYVSAPVVSQAAKMGIKTVIHEQNAFAGLSTRSLAAKVDKIFLSFNLAKPLNCSQDKIILTGNPVNPEFLEIDRKKAREELHLSDNDKLVLSFGGSLGATTINDAFLSMVSNYHFEDNIIFYHGASRSYAQMKEKLEGCSNRVELFEYIYNMPTVMAAADVVISRSGAMSLTEISALGKASILIPSPNVTENHQYFNAKNYEDNGAAYLLEEKDLTGEKLYQLIDELIHDDEKVKEMGVKAKSLINIDSTKMICNEIVTLLEG